jgi:hypothetical protein
MEGVLSQGLGRLGISYLKRLEWALKMKKRTVAEAINEHLWILDAPQASLIGELVEYLGLWDLIMVFSLQPGLEDAHIWQLSPTDRTQKNLHMNIFCKDQLPRG